MKNGLNIILCFLQPGSQGLQGHIYVQADTRFVFLEGNYEAVTRVSIKC